MERLQLTVTFLDIAPDNLDEFKQMGGDALKIAAEEPGLLQYDWFFNAGETTCVVRETFENSDAVLAHLGAVGPMIGPLVEIGGGIQLEVFGTPSEQLAAAIEPFGVTYYSFFQGK